MLKQEIAERNRAEENVRQSEEKYRTILESMAEGYYELDTSGNLKFFNDAFFKIVGYGRKDLMGANYRQFTDPQHANKVFRPLIMCMFPINLPKSLSGRLSDKMVKKDTWKPRCH